MSTTLRGQTSERRRAAFEKAGFAERVRLAGPVVQTLTVSAVDTTTHRNTEEPMLEDLVEELSGLGLPDFVTEDLDNNSSRLESFMAYAGAAYALGVVVGLQLSPDVFVATPKRRRRS